MKTTKILFLMMMLMITLKSNADLVFSTGNPPPPSQVTIGIAPIVMQYLLATFVSEDVTYALLPQQAAQVSVIQAGTTCFISPPNDPIFNTLHPNEFCTVTFSFVPGMKIGQYPSTLIAYAVSNGVRFISLYFTTSIVALPTFAK